MELRRIQYFVAVAEESHFGRAAERLRMAQPPLSQQIKALEAEMGVTLFRRTTRKVELTAAGERFLPRARSILAAVDDAVTEAGQVADGMLGRIAIGFAGSATYDLLPSLVRVLRADLPGIELDIHGEMLTPDQVTALVPASVQHLRITGATYLPLAGTTQEVELALATRAGETSPLVARVRARAQSLIGGGRRIRAGN
jgi:hypothetical protein